MSQATFCEKHQSVYDANSGNCRHCDAESRPMPPDREMTQEELEAIRNWMNTARPTPFNFAQFVLQARTHVAGLLAEVHRLRRVPASGERSEAVQGPDLKAIEKWWVGHARGMLERMEKAIQNELDCLHMVIRDVETGKAKPIYQDFEAPKGITEGGE